MFKNTPLNFIEKSVDYFKIKFHTYLRSLMYFEKYSSINKFLLKTELTLDCLRLMSFSLF